MNCEDLIPLLSRFPSCSDIDGGIELLTHCLYPSSDPVHVYISKLNSGFRVHDGAGAMRSAMIHGKTWRGALDKASRRHSVVVQGGALVAISPDEDWLLPAVLAVSNASAFAARLAVETESRSEGTLKDLIFEGLKRAVPESKIGRDFEYRGRSGHSWQVDFAVKEESMILVKSVVQNGNSINSNYATFGDIGDKDDVFKVSVFEQALNQDSESLLRQVSALVPLVTLTPFVQKRAYRSRLN